MTTVLTAVAVGLETQVATRVEQAQGVRLVRRCPDVEDLMAAGAARIATTVIVSADLPGLDRSVISALTADGCQVVGVHVAGDEDAQRRLRQLGVQSLLAVDAPPAAWSQALSADGSGDSGRAIADDFPGDGDPQSQDNIDEAISRELLGDSGPAQGSRRMPLGPPAGGASIGSAFAGHQPQGAAPLGSSPAGGSSRLPMPPTPAGPTGPVSAPAQETTDAVRHVIAVWGPTGAPGRTTVAVNLAAELARLGRTVVLVDADTYGASVAQHLALLDEAPGIAAAARLADTGGLSLPTLAQIAPEAVPGVRVLTGLPRADRWTEVRDDSLEQVLQMCQRLAQVTVIDVGFCLEEDEELSYDTRAPRRNAASVVALRAATQVVAVGAADPVGLQRLVRGLDELKAFAAAPRVVVNKVRSSAVGASPERRVEEALERFAGVGNVTLVPDDREAMDAAMLAGRTLAESAPTSPARRAVAQLAGDLVGVDVVLRSRVGLRGRRSRKVATA